MLQKKIMSCQIEQIADCGDISSIARSLFISDKEDPNWLTQCFISLSSCGNLLVVGYKNRLVILTAQWINSTETNTFIISWSGNVSSDISAVFAVPICPSNHSSQRGPDWYCILVGFINGSVGFYTNTGHLLLLEKFDESTVLKITCHTGTFGTLPDDICILYESSECIVSGSSLFKTLRYAKAQLAKVQAGVQTDYVVDGRSISVRRWTFTDQVINDGVVAGLELKNTYDHLLAASTYGGYDTWYRSIPPQSSLILGAGTKPYLGFHYALEGGTAPPLQDVARAVANKIKSALPGWLGGSSTETASSKAEPHIRSEALSMRSGLYDIQRQGARIVLSPDKRLAAITDNLGRVTVLDVSKGNIFRMFKGYRDAQCAFIQIFEVDDKKPQLDVIKDIRRALFLVIYNPKKGLIDIRLMIKGNRVAVFTATKNGTLLYNTSGLVGAEQNYVSRKLNLPEHQCVLIDPDGKLKRFDIPFFYALEGEHSDRSKDLHILRDLRDYIKKNNSTDTEFRTEILNRVSELNMIDLKKHCLEMLIRNYEVDPNIIMACLTLFWDSISDCKPDTQEEKCKIYFVNLVLTTLFYRLMNNENVDEMENLIAKVYKEINWDPKIDENDDSLLPPDTDSLQLLNSDKNVLTRLLNLAQEKDYKEHQHARVTFADKVSANYKLFVCSFELEQSYDQRYLHIKSDLSQEKFNSLAFDTFHSLFKIEEYSKISEYILKSKLYPKDLLKLVIINLMNTSLDDINIGLIQKLIGVLYCICRVSDEATDIIYNETSDWWQAVREMLVDMPCPLRSMIVAMACRVVVKLFEHKNGEDDVWESVTTENAKWSILIGRLEDISILSIILYFKETFNGQSLPKLEPTSLEINLKYIYDKGKGSVTELISKWFCTMGVIPEAIIANELAEKETPVNAPNIEDDDNYDSIFVENHKQYLEENAKIFKWFGLLRKQFPCSTLADNIIANMCWEYAVAWQKDIKDMKLLEAVIYCLKNIKDVHLGLGMNNMIWMTFIKNVFEVSCRLVNKVGKLPKERLCLQDVGITEKHLINFFNLTSQYLQNFVERSLLSDNGQIIRFKFEKIWDNTVPCLVDVAQDSHMVNNDILNLNFQISLSVLLQCKFNLKITKHLHSLYDVDLQIVFDKLSSEDTGYINNKATEKKLREPRMKFLNKVIMASIDLITCEESDDVNIFNKYQAGDMMEWIHRVHLLAELWNVEIDFIRRQQVIGLFRHGYDSLVDDVVRTVREPELLLPPVLAVASQRFKRHLEQATEQAEWLAAMPPDLVNHIERMELDSTIPPNPSMETTAAVIHNVLAPVENSDKPSVNKIAVRLARTMLRGCEIIQHQKF